MREVKAILAKAGKYRKRRKYFPSIFLLVLLVISLFTVSLIVKTGSLQDIRSRAEEDPGFCQDKCIGQDRCGPNGPPGDPNYNDPCCEEIKRTGDPGACPWPQRGYCTDDQCGSIPEGVNRQRCGGPRHSWCEKCIAAGCPGYGSAPQPTQPSSPPPTATSYIPPPTSTPIPTVFTPPTVTTAVMPTSIPTPIPTQWIYPTIIPSPTVFLFPTNIPVNYPTSYVLPTVSVPTLTPTTTPVKFSLPNILPPKEKVDNFIEDVRKRFLRFLSTILP